MLSTSFTHNQATITVQRGTVRSRLRATTLYAKFEVNEDMSLEDFREVEWFVRFLTQATVKGDLGFKLPSPAASPEDLQQALEQFMALDEAFYDAYIEALNAVDVEFNQPELQPVVEKKD